MKPMPLLIAVVLLAVLGGIVYYSEEHPPEADDAKVKVVDLKQDDIQAITINRPGKDPLTVRRGEDKEWKFGEPLSMKVEGFAAETLLASLTPMSADRVVEEKVDDWTPFGLGGDGTLRVTVEGTDGKSTQIIFGKDTPTGSTIYARLYGDQRLFTVPSHVKTGFEKEPFDLRDKNLLDIDQSAISRVILTPGTQTFEFGKSGDDKWQILQPKPLRADSFTVGDLVRSAANALMVSVLAEGETVPKEYSAAKPYAVVEVTDQDGVHTITVGKRSEDSYFAMSSDLPGGVYEVAKTFAESLNKQLADFRNKKLFDFGFQDPKQLELRDGETRLTIAKKDDKWVAASDGDRELDSAKVQAVIDSLRNLAAKAFASDEAADQPKYGLGSPAIEVTVTPSEEGKEQEKAAISSTEKDRVYAAIPGSPTTYELERNAVQEIQRSIVEVLKPTEPPPPAEEPAPESK
jgi:hypothetical protein